MKRLFIALLVALFAAAALPLVSAASDAPRDLTFFVEGEVVAYSADSITVETTTAAITPLTAINGNIAVGDNVFLVAQEIEGVVTALAIDRLNEPAPPGPDIIFVDGDIQAFDDGSITISGITAQINDQTIINGTPVVGDYALMVAERTDAGDIALQIDVLPDPPPPPPAIIWVEGEVTAFDGSSVTIAGVTAAITPETSVNGTLELGAYAYLTAQENEDGSYTALDVTVAPPPPPPVTFFDGVIEAIDGNVVTVSGQAILIGDATVINGNLEVGAMAFVIAEQQDNGDFLALQIDVIPDQPVPPPNIVFLEGIVDSWDGSNLVVDGTTVAVTDATIVYGTISVGAYALIVAEQIDNGGLVALEIQMSDGPPPPPPTLITLQGPIEAVTDTSVTVAGQTALINGATIVIGELVVGEEAFVLAEVLDNGDIIAITIEVYSQPGNTLVFLDGIIEAFDDSSLTLSGVQIGLVPDTQIVGTLELGAYASVAAEQDDNGALTAFSIEVIGPPPPPPPTIIFVIGDVVAVSDASVTIGNQVLQIGPNTDINGDLVVGAVAVAIAEELEDGSFLALIIEVVPPMDNPEAVSTHQKVTIQ